MRKNIIVTVCLAAWCLSSPDLPSTCHANWIVLQPSLTADYVTLNSGATSLHTPASFEDSSPSQYGPAMVESGAVFDLSVIPPGSTIVSASLSIVTYFAQGNSISPSPSLTMSAFDPGTLAITMTDFTSPVDILGTAKLPQNLSPTSPATSTFDATGQLPSATAYLGVILQATGNAYSHAPTLTVTYTPAAVPEPSSLALTALGLGAVGVIRRWRLSAARRVA